MKRLLLFAALLLAVPAGADRYPPSGGLPYPWKSVKVTLTSAQVAALFTTPQLLLPADTSVQRYLMRLRVYKPSGTAYTVPGTSDLAVTTKATAPYETGGLWSLMETTGFLDQAGALRLTIDGPSGGTQVRGNWIEAVGGLTFNVPVYIAMKTANVTAGGAQPSLTFELWYEEWKPLAP